MSDRDLGRLLLRLATLVAADQAAQVQELQRRQRAGVLRVLVVGEAKRGESSVVNALLGRPLLPTGVVPVTAVATTIAYGAASTATVYFQGGRSEPIALERLSEFVTETANPGNVRGVGAVTVRVPAALLADGVELVDTPGTGSVHEHNTTAAQAALGQMDAAVFVLSADPPVSAAERLWLRQVRDQAVRVFCVLNKADHLSADELAQSVAFTRQVLAGELGADVAVWPVSARGALAAAQDAPDQDAPDLDARHLDRSEPIPQLEVRDRDGLDQEAASPAGDLAPADREPRGDAEPSWWAFRDAFAGYLHECRHEDLARSVTGRAARLADGVGEQASVTLAALRLSVQDLNERVSRFGDRIDLVEQDRFAAAALLTASVRRLQQQGDLDAEAFVAAAGPALAGDVGRYLDALAGSARELGAQALAYAGEQIRRRVDPWQAARAAALDEAVAELDADSRQRLAGHIAAGRQAASGLFALDLPPLPPTGPLVQSDRFSYALGPDVGQTDALAAAVRTRLPGRWGRRQVRRYVRARAVELLDRNCGRVRADLRARLTQSERDLQRELDRRYTEGAGRIS